MKKITAIILAMAMAASLTACDSKENPNSSDNSDSNSSVTGTSDSSDGETDNSGNSENSSPESDPDSVSEPSIEELIAAFPLDSFTAPDGSTISKSEATNVLGDNYMIGFDFAYLRYPTPIFHNTLQEPDLVNLDTFEWKTDYPNTAESPEYFKVKAGDTLKNGLVVESAAMYFDHGGYVIDNRVTFSNTVTVEGILRHYDGEPEYMLDTDTLRFYSDPTKENALPIAYYSSSNMIFPYIDNREEFAMISDYDEVVIGGVLSEMSADIADLFRNGNYVRVKATFDNIRIQHGEQGGMQGIIAQLVSAELIDNT